MLEEEALVSNMNALCLKIEDLEKLAKQDTRLVSPFQAEQIEKNAKKNWDLFYKRNETRFFKDRHWTTREFMELVGDANGCRTLLEVGCGVGNLIYPLLDDGLDFYFHACDFSPRAVEFVKSHSKYDNKIINVFQCDITTKDIFKIISRNTVDIVTLIFVLSSIHPDKFKETVSNIFQLLKPGGLLLFRDYGQYDMAQLRFKPGSKISENFYVRQDGTRSYYFTDYFLKSLMQEAGFKVIENMYINRKTVNIKENVNADRIFTQGKFRKCQS